MIPFLIGAACLAATWALRGSAIPTSRAAPWLLAPGFLVVVQLVFGAGRVDPYRVTVLGYRYGLEEPAAAQACVDDCSPGTSLGIGGDALTADVWAPGAGLGEAGTLETWTTEDGAEPPGRRRLRARVRDDAAAVVLVQGPGRGDSWTVVGASRLDAGDTVRILAGDSVVAALTVTARPHPWELMGTERTVPWLAQHVVHAAGGASPAGAVPLEGYLRIGVAGLGARRPNLFQRVFPLADVVAGSIQAPPTLGSFFYYQSGALWFADLDSEVRVGSALAPTPEPVPSGARLMVAGLPHRDHPDPGVELPGRFGVRPLRTFRAEHAERRLDLLVARQEVRSLDRDWLEESTRILGPGQTTGYRLRLGSPVASLNRGDLTLRSVPTRIRTEAQAIFELDRDPGTAGYRIVTPGGAGSGVLGRPLALGNQDRALLLRVDGQKARAAFLLLHVLVFLLPLGLMGPGRRSGSVLALAVLGSGFAGLRLLLAWSSHLTDPFLAEGPQLALWLVPALPVAVVLAGDLGRTLSAGSVGSSHGAGERPRGAGPGTTAVAPYRTQAAGQAGPTAPPRGKRGRRWDRAWIGTMVMAWTAFGVLTTSLFSGSGVRVALLLLACAALGCTALVTRRRGAVSALLRGWDRQRRRLSRLGDEGVWPLAGLLAGVTLLTLRIAFDLAGWREGMQLGSTRIAVSTWFTPAVLGVLAILLVGHGRQVAWAERPEDQRRATLAALVSIGSFLALALAGVSLWISDFGIVLVGLPGILLAVAVLGAWWSGGTRERPGLVLVAVLPLALFLGIQAAPVALAPILTSQGAGQPDRLADWNRNELLLLERGDPQALGLIGQRRSEALAVMRETMRSYTRGNLTGRGYLRGRVTTEIRPTAPREHAVSALLVSQWGAGGGLGLCLLLVGLLLTGLRTLGPPPRSRSRLEAPLVTAVFVAPVILGRVLPSPWGVAAIVAGAVAVLAWGVSAPSSPVTRSPGAGPEPGQGSPGASRTGPERDPNAHPSDVPGIPATVAALFLFTLAGAGLYMVLANYGLAFFTGKNVYLLGVDSVSDMVEGTALLAGAALAIALASPAPTRPAPPPARIVGNPRPVLAVAGTREGDGR